MTFSAGSHRSDVHLLFRAAFTQWHARAGALSALPDAPVVPDEPRLWRPAALWRLVGAAVPGRAARRPRARCRPAPQPLGHARLP